MITSLLELFAKEHPAIVHLPIGLVVALQLAMLGSFDVKRSLQWTRIALFLAIVALASSLAALLSGLLWGRQVSLIPVGGYVPKITSATQVLQRVLQVHEYAAAIGVGVGTLCVVFIWRAWRPIPIERDGILIHRRKLMGRRLRERGVGLPALFLGLLWLGSWGFCGRLGGIMVFGNEETNKASAIAEAKRKADVEADLPIRALDYASLEPTQAMPVKSKAHGGRWQRVWVTASGIDAYKAGKPLPTGAYVVLSTFEDDKGKASHEPGPLYMKEVRGDGSAAFVFYWQRVPENQRAQTDGSDSVYWRTPDPHLNACEACHNKEGH